MGVKVKTFKVQGCAFNKMLVMKPEPQEFELPPTKRMGVAHWGVINNRLYYVDTGCSTVLISKWTYKDKAC